MCVVRGGIMRYSVLIFSEKEIGQLTCRESNLLHAVSYCLIKPLFIEKLQFARHHVEH